MDSSLHGIKYVIPKYSGKLSHRIWFFRVNPSNTLGFLSVFFLMHFPVMEERALIAVIVLSCFPQIWLL